MAIIDSDILRMMMWDRCGASDVEIDKGRARWDGGLWIRYKVFEECLAEVPTIEAEPIKLGRWIDVNNYHIGTCSACGNRWGTVDQMHYCPSCGADMQSTMGQVKRHDAVNEEAQP